MTTQSTIDRINDAIIALGQMKDLLLRGNADRPDSEDVWAAESRVRRVCMALDAVAFEYDADNSCLTNALEEMDFAVAARSADERLEQVRR